MPMVTTQAQGILSFIQQAESLKKHLRTAWSSDGRHESIAEHTWRMSLLAMCLLPYEQELNPAKVLKICLIHDLGEACEGDVSAILSEDKDNKAIREKVCLDQLLQSLEPQLRGEFLSLWQEYNEGHSAEAKFVRGVDKLETLIQHNQGLNPVNLDFAFNLEYGSEWTSRSETLSVLRTLIDNETSENAKKDKLKADADGHTTPNHAQNTP
ncbi:MAG: HD domain-containing protein [Acidaminobacter sp.]|uniref:HD domain-containing protein n=1 Tax=Acidaminobacter sp. TaxID=1872102 RepID=UPI001385E4B9|nr:HD domain-containing protein [Acidaminobacter sp.]MZQ98396.1 HD domain-containing protein [Acidaminobacter sp.]